ncbi:pentapeptide repeat-containing protein [Cellulomonas telluris]|uniref:pentapeptide repeat-containing protein n=1 Tax=Cellulomonas telluris TaxID=2306636 RepID=UPI0010A7C32C|nr:pentapeptide repeat-containing protein [Cellulomonas telluris]
MDATADDLVPDADLDALTFEGLDLSGRDASGARFLECELTGCRADGLRLDHARLLDTTWTAVQAGDVRAPGSAWRDVTLTDVRLGALGTSAAEVVRLRVVGGKVDYLDLRGATVDGLHLERVTLGDLDLSGATVRKLVVVDCDVRRLDTSDARLRDVDLRGARLTGGVDGVGGLAGATISGDQLLDLAPLLAAHLGLRVR